METNTPPKNEMSEKYRYLTRWVALQDVIDYLQKQRTECVKELDDRGAERLGKIIAHIADCLPEKRVFCIDCVYCVREFDADGDLTGYVCTQGYDNVDTDSHGWCFSGIDRDEAPEILKRGRNF